MVRISILLLTIIIFIGSFFLDGFKFQFLFGTISVSMFFIILSTMAKNIIIQYASILIFSLGFALSGLELYYGFKTHVMPETWVRDTGSYPKSMITENEILGYSLLPNSTGTMSKDVHFRDKKETENIFNVVYTADQFGRRSVAVNPYAKTAVVFLGCSFTFGIGLNDDETFAYKVAEQLGEKYQVFNLGVGGYGTHQVLEILKGDLSYLDKYEKIYIFHTTMEDHLRRLSGFASWDTEGPRFMLEEGKLVHKGKLNAYFPYNLQGTILGKILDSSLTYKANLHLLREMILPYVTEDEIFPVYNAIMAETDKVIKQKYPDSVHIAIVWDTYKNKEMGQNIPKHIFQVDVHDWFPDFRNNREKYAFSDYHPNQHATSIAAKHIVELVHQFEKK